MTLPIRESIAFLILGVAAGCGHKAPPDPWYPRALGPTEVPVSDAEATVLASLDGIPGEGEVQAGSMSAFVEAPYHAASNRRCRRVRFVTSEGVRVRTACETPDGWRLAADVFDGGAPR